MTLREFSKVEMCLTVDRRVDYRQSRICRRLGNPVVYQLIVLPELGGSMTPSKLAMAAGR